MANMIAIAQAAVKEVEAVFAAGGYTIDRSADLDASGMTGYQARMMHGEFISAVTASEATINQAARAIGKIYEKAAKSLKKRGVSLKDSAEFAEFKAAHALLDEVGSRYGLFQGDAE